MKPLDRWLQRRRIAQAAPWIPAGTRVLDIGCGDGALFRQLGPRLGGGIGIEPGLPSSSLQGAFTLKSTRFPDPTLAGERFGAITALAVIEHIPEPDLPPFAAAATALLQPGGRCILTAPAPAVDAILAALRALRLIDGMSLDEHHGFDPNRIPALFQAPGLRLLRHHRFQCGLNHLFVLEKP